MKNNAEKAPATTETAQLSVVTNIASSTKQFLGRAWQYVWGHKWIALFTALVVLGGVYYFFFRTTSTTTYEYAKVARKTLTSSVEGSGNISAKNEVSLKTSASGVVTAVLVKPGDHVKVGQTIARLDGRSAAIQLSQAQANYRKVAAGSTQSELAIAAAQLESSKISLDNAKQNLELTKKEQNTNVDNARRAYLNSGLAIESSSTLNTNSPQLGGTYSCPDEGEYRISIGRGSTQVNVAGALINVYGLEQVQVVAGDNPQPIGTCGLTLKFDTSKTYYGGSEWKIRVPNKTSAEYITAYNAFLSAEQSRDKATANAEASIRSAEASLTSSQASYDQKKAGADPNDLASSAASIESARLSYENTIVTAPFSGVIGSVSIQKGQQVSSGTEAATLASSTKVVAVTLNEVDIPNVKLGQKVDLTFDAISNLALKGTVSEIDAIGTETSNVVTFKVQITLDGDDDRVKPGMSVTASVITDTHENVLVVPSGAIKTENGKSYVMVKKGSGATSKNTTGDTTKNTATATVTSSEPKSEGGTNGTGSGTRGSGKNKTSSTSSLTATTNEKVYVETGLSSDTETEITSGLTEGQEVVSRTISTATKTTSSSLLGGGGSGRPPF
jgi:HlyD family secretion protein